MSRAGFTGTGMRLTPLYVFDDPAEYHRRHKGGVLQEFNNESREVTQFNKRDTQFKAWIVAKLDQGRGCSYWIFFIRPTESVEYIFPREGEFCDITLWAKSGRQKRWEKPWEAERIESPAASFGITDISAHRLPAFKVRVPSNVPDDILNPLEEDPDDVGYDQRSRLRGKYAFGDRKAYRVTMMLRISSATKDAEIGAIEKLFTNPDNVLTDKQKAAFKYLLNFRDVPFKVNLFNHFPHLRDPMKNPLGMPPKVITMLKGFNEHQRTAYKEVLSTIPAGVCIIPGGPGAGKTHWNLVLTAAIQSKDVIYHGPNSSSNRAAKVLYILDINKPLDDTCNKIVKLYKSLGLRRHAVRLHGWHYGHNKEVPDFSYKFLTTVRMNRYRRQTFNEGCLAPSLDELAFNIYEANRATRYRELSSLIGSGKSERLRDLINQLYQDVLAQVDFIATTPVPAATGFNGLYKPDIVIFDESPHAREASTMVAIAQYNPIAWIFSGDHRQTRPFIASDDVRDNPWAPQMLVSMMERADRAGAIRFSLLINHRAYGGLQELASEMFYAKKMISGHQKEELFPPSVQHIQRFLERFLPAGQKCKQPRLIAFDGRRGEQRVGTSWFNDSHIEWVMQRVMELLPDTMFRQVGKNERGTILIISPYKESFMRYKRAIRDLPREWQARLNVEARCEARTIDTCQGGEADFVFLDMVRSESTDFTDDPNRLNVAITRARQGEIIMMHPGMRRAARFLAGIFGFCDAMGQVVDISVRGQPRQVASVPNEQKAYEEHVRYQAQFDQERVAHGLEPIATETKTRGLGPIADDDFEEDEVDDGPMSVFAEKFANLGLADYMQGILKENKVDRNAKQPQREAALKPEPSGSGQAQDTAPQVKAQLLTRNGVQAPTQTLGSNYPQAHTQRDYQAQKGHDVARGTVPASHMTAAPAVDTHMSELANGSSKLDVSRTRSSNAPTSGSSANAAPPQRQTSSGGLGQSRWYTSPGDSPGGYAKPAANPANGVNGAPHGAAMNPATPRGMHPSRPVVNAPGGPAAFGQPSVGTIGGARGPAMNPALLGLRPTQPEIGAQRGLAAFGRPAAGANDGARDAPTQPTYSPASPGSAAFGQPAVGMNGGARGPGTNPGTPGVRPTQPAFGAQRGPADPVQHAPVANVAPQGGATKEREPLPSGSDWW